MSPSLLFSKGNVELLRLASSVARARKLFPLLERKARRDLPDWFFSPLSVFERNVINLTLITFYDQFWTACSGELDKQRVAYFEDACCTRTTILMKLSSEHIEGSTLRHRAPFIASQQPVAAS